MEEVYFLCPFCSASISMLLDASVDHQHYVEDCEMCCHPIEISYRYEQGDLIDFSAESS